MTAKKCRKCQEEKELTTDFFPRNKNSKDGFDSACKECWKAISKAKTARKASEPKTAAARLSSSQRGVPAYKLHSVNKPASEQVERVERPDRFAHQRVEESVKGLQVISLKRLADLPRDMILLRKRGKEREVKPATYFGREGQLKAVVRAYMQKYSSLPRMVYTFDPPHFPRRYFMPVPEPVEEDLKVEYANT